MTVVYTSGATGLTGHEVPAGWPPHMLMGVPPAPARAGVLHVVLDDSPAAVETARRPGLRGKPVVVGGAGDPTQRAVVATASYEAREFGIHSGMPLRTAAKRCPDAVFLPSDPPAYNEVSEAVMSTLRELPVVVEVLGWDEAFLGAHTSDPEALAAEVQRAVNDATGLSCSVGIGDNKLRAKLATGFAKPAGVYRLTRDNWVSVMGDRPTEALWGIGHKTARKLADAGLTTVAELARADPAELAKRFGPTMGPWYRVLALGAGSAEVTPDPYVPRSRSRETTFQQNLTDRAELHPDPQHPAGGADQRHRRDRAGGAGGARSVRALPPCAPARRAGRVRRPIPPLAAARRTGRGTPACP